MQKAFLSRLGTWLCLLGSALALGAFFLPCVTYAPGSLEDCLTSCALDQVLQSPGTQFSPVPWGVGTLLLLVLGVAALAFLMLFLRSFRNKIVSIYLRLTTLTLIYYFVTALITLFAAWVGEALAAPVTFTDVLSWIGIGAWLMSGSLLLALIGGTLITRNPRQSVG